MLPGHGTANQAVQPPAPPPLPLPKDGEQITWQWEDPDAPPVAATGTGSGSHCAEAAASKEVEAQNLREKIADLERAAAEAKAIADRMNDKIQQQVAGTEVDDPATQTLQRAARCRKKSSTR